MIITKKLSFNIYNPLKIHYFSTGHNKLQRPVTSADTAPELHRWPAQFLLLAQHQGIRGGAQGQPPEPEALLLALADGDEKKVRSIGKIYGKYIKM